MLTVADLFAGFVCTGEDVLKNGDDYAVVTDNKNFLQYNLVKSFFKDNALKNFRFLLSKRSRALPDNITIKYDDKARGDFYVSVCKSSVKRGIYNKVDKLLETALSLSPSNASGIDLLGDISFRRNEFTEAISMWRRNLDFGGQEYRRRAKRKIAKAKKLLHLSDK